MNSPAAPLEFTLRRARSHMSSVCTLKRELQQRVATTLFPRQAGTPAQGAESLSLPKRRPIGNALRKKLENACRTGFAGELVPWCQGEGEGLCARCCAKVVAAAGRHPQVPLHRVVLRHVLGGSTLYAPPWLFVAWYIKSVLPGPVIPPFPQEAGQRTWPKLAYNNEGLYAGHGSAQGGLGAHHLFRRVD